jgi:hypothetical protein
MANKSSAAPKKNEIIFGDVLDINNTIIVSCIYSCILQSVKIIIIIFLTFSMYGKVRHVYEVVVGECETKKLLGGIDAD